MPLKRLLLLVAPGLIPLAIFGLVSAVWGDLVGLAVGVGLGIATLIFILIRQKRLDWFVLVDTSLLAAVGLISIINVDETIIRLKPAFTEGILAVLVAISVFGPSNLLMGMALRGAAGEEFRKRLESLGDVRRRLRGLLLGLLVVLAIHIGLVVWASLWADRTTWAFVSDALLLIFLGAWLGVQILVTLLLRARQRSEMLPVVDNQGTVIGQVSRVAAHQPPFPLHPVVRLLVTDGSGRILIQKRSATKAQSPNFWDSSVAGHVNVGENLAASLRRESREEIGLRLGPDQATHLGSYRFEAADDRELAFVFMVEHGGPFKANPKEVAELRWLDPTAIRALPRSEVTPGLLRDLELFAKTRQRR